MIQLVAEASPIHMPQRPRPLEARDFVVIVARKLSAISPRFAQSVATRVADALFAWHHRRLRLRALLKPRISAQGTYLRLDSREGRAPERSILLASRSAAV